MDIFIIVALILYTAFKDVIYYKEREKLQLKLMSRNLEEYTENVSPVEEVNTPQEEDPYIPVGEATIEQILKAEDIV